ncbi:MAG: 3-keto-5-aminohexanoate cleavage protein, partial [Rhodobacteraceae bacterium]|nr:3-keto-5-aminohexanoate cleavage protein [Paracoccaceae bacterium]
MSNPCILCCAITGSVPRKSDNPAVPTTVEEQIESSHAAVEAGASIIHAHVRNDDETPSSDPERFARLKEGLEKHCPGVIIQFSTGGRSGAGKERGGMLSLRPDMASLSVGSNNFPTRVYENSPDLVAWLSSEMQKYEIMPEIEAFDLSHLLQAIRMHDEGKLYGRLYVQFVMGVKNAMPCDKEVFDFYVHMMKTRAPKAAWCAAGIGANQAVVNEWAIAAGGHTR